MSKDWGEKRFSCIYNTKERNKELVKYGFIKPTITRENR
jgi:hypothetical protein